MKQKRCPLCSKKKKPLKLKKKGSKKCSSGLSPINIKNNKKICVGKCTHSGGPILYNKNKDILYCPWHDSQFTMAGKVIKGPAIKKLKISK